MSSRRKRIVGLPCGRRLIFTISVIFTALYPLVVRAQTPNVQFNNKAVDFGDRGDLRVNPTTFGMEIQLPLRTYPGRAGASLPVTLSYSSKVWRLDYNFYNPGHYDYTGPIGDGYTGLVARYAERSMSGWTSSLGFPYVDNIPTQYYDFNGGPKPDSNSCGASGCYIIDRVLIWMPDGSSHEFRSTDQPKSIFDQTPFPDALYAVDGSRMRYQRSTQTLFMPDGSRYFLNANQYVDRNGNTLTYDSTNSRWLDALGRSISLPPMGIAGTNMQPSISPGNYTYSVPGVNGASVNYTFVWKNLGDTGVLTIPQPLQYTADSGCPPGNGTNSPHLFASDSGSRTCIINANSVFNPVVLYQIQLPTGSAYTFTYNIYGEIDKVQLPTGGYERYEYSTAPSVNMSGSIYLQANRGVVNRFVSPSGTGSDEAQSHYAGGGLTPPISITAPDNSLAERYLRGVIILGGSPSWSYTPDEAMSGAPYDERYYSTPDSGGTRHMLRRKLTEWSMTGSNAVGQSAGGATRNARPTKEVEIIFDTGGPALARMTTHEYDLSYQFSTGVNETATNEYDYVLLDQSAAQTIDIGSVPTGSLLRRTEKTYLDATNQAYRDRNLLGLVTSVTVKDAAGNVFAQSTTTYDEGGQFAQLNDYSNVVNWTDPQTTYRGNPTTTSHWLNFDGASLSTFPNGTYLTAHAQYDQCGSVRKTWDARDTTSTNPSQISYMDAFSDGVARNTYAYPTNVTTAVPDLNGTYGSNAAFVTTSVYDFNTGRVKSTTDANNQTTTIDYTDSLNRLKTVTRPDGGITTYNYSDTPGSLYVETLIKQDSTRNIDAYQFFDGLGRPNRAFLNIGNGNYNTTDTQYDNMGRVYRVSNPYVSTSLSSPINPSGYWTTTAYDALGRVLSVTTPDNAVVTTTYAGTTSGTLGMTVLVTDQAGRQRRSLTDALGRLVRVDEPDANGNLDSGGSPVQPTSYAYDLLGNLRQVSQGSQQRFFMYDSLSRLIRARNPEQTVNPSLNLIDSVTNNSQWAFAYSYDANGNLLAKTDARGVVATYTYDGLNRNTSITYTSDPAGTPTVSRFYDGWRSGIYNSSIGNSKGRLWQTETSGAAGTRNTIDNYDVMGRPTKREQQFYNSAWGQSYVVQTSYDLAGHVTTMTYPSGRVVSYNYDAAGRLGDKDAQNLAFTGNLGDGMTLTYSAGITYSPFGGMTQEQFGTTTPIYNKLNYNTRGQLAEILASTTGSDSTFNRGKLVNDYSDQCSGASCNGTDNNGNLKKQTVYIPNNDQNTSPTSRYQQYGYDSLNRLTLAHEYTGNTSLDWQQAYNYDRWGNRTIDIANTSAGIPHPSFNVDTNTNRLTVPSGQTGTMGYDYAGNLTNDTYSGAAVLRAYDAENRMTSETQANSYVAGTYTYDGNGQRVRRKVNGVETWQVYGLSGELIAEYPANANQSNPQKEYGYRNGQLLITAEAATASAPPPTALAANPPTSGANLTLNWTAASGATNYRVERKGVGGAYVSIGTTSTTNFTDIGASIGSAYLYQVCAADGAGNCTSGYSNIVLGARFNFPTDPTIKTFAEDPLNATPMRAAHITELRSAVNAVRSLAGLSAATWTNPTLTPGVSVISADDVRDLRSRLNDALIALGIQTSAYTDPSIVSFAQDPLNATPVRAVHIRELRQRATSGIGGSGGSAGTSVQTHWLVSDQLGTPRMIFDQTGLLANVSRHDYLPFGEDLFAGTGGRTTAQGYSASDGVRQHFTHKERDIETGLDYFGARYYGSTQGRFTSADPIVVTFERLIDPQRLNLYSYVRNNTLAYVDPNGADIVSIQLVNNGPNQLAQNDPKWKSQEAGRVEQLGPVVNGGNFVFTVNIVVTVTPDDSPDNYDPVQKSFVIQPVGQNTDIHRPGESGTESPDNPEKQNVSRSGNTLVWFDNPGLETKGMPPASVNGGYVAVFKSTVKPKKGSDGKATDKTLYWGVKLEVKDGKIVNAVAVPITQADYNKLTGQKPPKPPPPPKKPKSNESTN